MIYVSISLRYHRQLNLICPDVLESFFKEVAAAAKANGAFISQAGSVCAFDSKDICCAFSVFLTIEAILKLAEERKNRIKEYFVFVDSSEKALVPDEIAYRMSACDNHIFPDRAVALAREAAGLLSPYATFEDVAGSELALFRAAKPIKEGAAGSSAFLSKPAALPFFAAKESGECFLLLSLLNTASLLAIGFNPETFLTKKEAAAFAEDKKAVKRIAAARFAAAHPLYIIEAAEDYLKLFFVALSRFYAESRGSETVELEVPEGSFSAKELARFEELLSETCVFNVLEKDTSLKRDNFDAGEIPPDIMGAAYLYFRAALFLFAGETCDLLSFLGKGSSFREAVELRISAAGFPRSTDFFSCVQSLVEKGFPAEPERKRLDKYLFDYLLEQCKSGEICSCLDFYEQLLTLGIKIPDSLLAAAVYSSPNPGASAEKLKENFSNPDIVAAIKDQIEAEKKLNNGDCRAAQTEAKRVLQVFQQARIPIGEFEAFSFLARVTFSTNNASFDDAFSYLNYALEGSARMQNSGAQMRTLFDFASMQFLSGNFFQAQGSVRRLREKADERYDKGWVFAACFLEGMLYFSLGDYVACKKIFSALEEACASLGLEKAAPLSSAWVFRSKAYLSKKALAAEWSAELCGSAQEAALFALESIAKAAIEGENDQEAESLFCKLPAKIKSVPQEGSYITPDAWSWRSSFAFEEDRYFRGGPAGAASLLYAAFHAFCAAFCSKERSAFAAARDTIAALIRDKMHPNSPRAYIFYCLCFELESQITGKNSAEALSFLSRAFKGVQVIGNNIDDAPMRERFMTRPYWNALLYSAARENNLI